MNLYRIASTSSQSNHEEQPRRRSLRKKNGDGTLSKMSCIFWNKVDRIRVKSQGSLKWHDHKGGQQIIDIATQSSDDSTLM